MLEQVHEFKLHVCARALAARLRLAAARAAVAEGAADVHPTGAER